MRLATGQDARLRLAFDRLAGIATGRVLAEFTDAIVREIEQGAEPGDAVRLVIADFGQINRLALHISGGDRWPPAVFVASDQAGR